MGYLDLYYKVLQVDTGLDWFKSKQILPCSGLLTLCFCKWNENIFSNFLTTILRSNLSICTSIFVEIGTLKQLMHEYHWKPFGIAVMFFIVFYNLSKELKYGYKILIIEIIIDHSNGYFHFVKNPFKQYY